MNCNIKKRIKTPIAFDKEKQTKNKKKTCSTSSNESMTNSN